MWMLALGYANPQSGQQHFRKEKNLLMNAIGLSYSSCLIESVLLKHFKVWKSLSWILYCSQDSIIITGSGSLSKHSFSLPFCIWLKRVETAPLSHSLLWYLHWETGKPLPTFSTCMHLLFGYLFSFFCHEKVARWTKAPTEQNLPN